MLSKRLLEIAKLINKNETVYDVGTDHALLPCFLIENDIAKKVYASDNKEGPLNAAKENIKLRGYEDRIVTVLADGLDKCPTDVDVVTISGMGYHTVEHIFEGKDLSRYKRLIVQINKHPEMLRQYISDHEYTILDEVIVKDDFWYEIIVFNTEKGKKLDKREIEYGPLNCKRSLPEFKEYLQFMKKKYEKINNDAYGEKLAEIEDLLNKG